MGIWSDFVTVTQHELCVYRGFPGSKQPQLMMEVKTDSGMSWRPCVGLPATRMTRVEYLKLLSKHATQAHSHHCRGRITVETAEVAALTSPTHRASGVARVDATHVSMPEDQHRALIVALGRAPPPPPLQVLPPQEPDPDGFQAVVHRTTRRRDRRRRIRQLIAEARDKSRDMDNDDDAFPELA